MTPHYYEDRCGAECGYTDTSVHTFKPAAVPYFNEKRRTLNQKYISARQFLCTTFLFHTFRTLYHWNAQGDRGIYTQAFSTSVMISRGKQCFGHAQTSFPQRKIGLCSASTSSPSASIFELDGVDHRGGSYWEDNFLVQRIPEATWRASAARHTEAVKRLLQPGLLETSPPTSSSNDEVHVWTGLDPRHPVYNFLIQYYGLKGVKGPRRLAKWSPSLFAPLTSDGTKEGRPRAVLLEGASLEHDCTALSLEIKPSLSGKGANLHPDGLLYCPALFGQRTIDRSSSSVQTPKELSSYLWYLAVMRQTLQANPVWYCHGLHEWAMQYQLPETAAARGPPPSAQYQAHLPLRVSQEVLRHTVESQGISCTHVDALRYFSDDARKHNSYGPTLERHQQLQLEQPGCVHAHMDLIKMALKLQPFLDADILRQVLEVALQARKLDVAASPYDATHVGLNPIPVETAEGRAQYRRQQAQVLRRAQAVRYRLYCAYHEFLQAAYPSDVLQAGGYKPLEKEDILTVPLLQSKQESSANEK